MLKFRGVVLSKLQQLHTMLPQTASIEFHHSSSVSWFNELVRCLISLLNGMNRMAPDSSMNTNQKLPIFNRKHEEIHGFGPFCGASIRQIFVKESPAQEP